MGQAPNLPCQGDTMLKVDSSLFIQIINFLVLVFLLNLILFRPIRQIISKRNGEFESLGRQINTFGQLCDGRAKAIEEAISKARREGALEKENLRKQGSLEEEKILKETNAVVQEKLRETKKQIEEGIIIAKKSLEQQVELFSRELAEKILGRTV